MKKKTKLDDQDIALSVMHYSLPIALRAVVHSSLDQRTRAILDYARIKDIAATLQISVQRVDYWIRPHGTQPALLPSIVWQGKRIARMSDAKKVLETRPKRGRPAKPKAV